MPWTEAGLQDGWTLEGPGAEGLPALVPGTVAGAFRAAGRPVPDDLDEQPWTFRTVFATPEGDGPVWLRLEGLATLATVELGGEALLESSSMWRAHAVEVTGRLAPIGAPNELTLRFAPLGPELRRPRRPRARWRTRLVAGGLRWHRTMLLGRMPGIAPGPAAVGPWRPVVLERREGPGCTGLRLRARLSPDGDGLLAVHPPGLEGVEPGSVEVVLDGPSGVHRAALDPEGRALLRVPGVARWWPHTHGEPVLHRVRLLADGEEIARTRVGFRTLRAGATDAHDVERDGLDLHVNGVRTWARGAVWTPIDLVGLAPGRDELRETLTAVRDCGMNLVRVVGTAAYETDAFHDLCDELGLLVWQDAMFANLDYPLGDPAFAETVREELEVLVARLAGRASTTVLCGGSEIGQQVAMLGLEPALARDGAGYTLLPAAVEAAGCDAVVVPEAPCGGPRPFRTDVGVANYFGVGGYRRGLDDVRRAEVRFASECLALANLPGDEVLAAAGPDGGVPRDAGAAWDFADVRDHYLRLLHGVDPAALRAADPERYRELSRAVSGEVMAEVMGEWRRAASPCGGAIILWLRDLVPGAGWGLLDHRGQPKEAFHHLGRALAPLAVWTTDEGLNGIAVHVANDGPVAFSGALLVSLVADGGRIVEETRTAIEVRAHTTAEYDFEALLGRWADVSGAFGFGPPAHEAVAVALQRGDVEVSRAVRRPSSSHPPPAVGEGRRAADPFSSDAGPGRLAP